MLSLNGWKHRLADHLGDASLHLALLALVRGCNQTRQLVFQGVQVDRV
jgi:hypothetical protein